MDDGSFPRSKWSTILQTAANVVKRLPTRANGGDTRHKLCYGKEANVSHLRETGCKALVHKELPDRDRVGQLHPAVERGKLIGCCAHSPSYTVLINGALIPWSSHGMPPSLNSRRTRRVRTTRRKSRRRRKHRRRKYRNRRIVRLAPLRPFITTRLSGAKIQTSRCFPM